eukprot:802200-Pleurochrysis_carterae.AAC.6
MSAAITSSTRKSIGYAGNNAFDVECAHVALVTHRWTGFTCIPIWSRTSCNSAICATDSKEEGLSDSS